MRKIALLAVTLALFIIPVASVHMAGAEPAQQTQNQTPTTAATTQPAADTTPAPAPTPATVTVQSGDTLCGIAAANNTTYGRLYQANSFIANPDLIYPGQQIRIPGSDEPLTDRTAAAPAPTVVTVAHGDTLGSVAKANGTTTQRLYDANPSISDPNVIHPGDQITIPTSDAQLAERAMPTPVVAAPAKAVAPQPVVHQAAAAPARAAAPAPVRATTTAAVTTGTPNSAAKAYIYAHESSNNPNATNYLGCYGLGQDCSGKLRALCGPNYACQDAFFDNYAQQRYGGWANAQAFWVAHHWW